MREDGDAESERDGGCEEYGVALPLVHGLLVQ